MCFSVSELFIPDNVTEYIIGNPDDPYVIRRFRDGEVFDPLPCGLVSEVFFSEAPGDGDESSKYGFSTSIAPQQPKYLIPTRKFSQSGLLFRPRFKILNKGLLLALLLQGI